MSTRLRCFVEYGKFYLWLEHGSADVRYHGSEQISSRSYGPIGISVYNRTTRYLQSPD